MCFTNGTESTLVGQWKRRSSLLSPGVRVYSAAPTRGETHRHHADQGMTDTCTNSSVQEPIRKDFAPIVSESSASPFCLQIQDEMNLHEDLWKLYAGCEVDSIR